MVRDFWLLKDEYGYDMDIIHDACDKLEKFEERANKYINRYKKKRLTIERGCFNQILTRVELNKRYELLFYYEDNGKEKLFADINVKHIIQNDYIFKYDYKYHILTAF